MRSIALVMAVGLGWSGSASANPGPHGDDPFHTEPAPAPQPPDRLALGVGLIAGGVVSFAGGAALQPSWFVLTCTASVPSDCVRSQRQVAMGSIGIALMVTSVGLTIPGAILTHRARMRRKAESAKLRAMVGPRFIGLAGRF